MGEHRRVPHDGVNNLGEGGGCGREVCALLNSVIRPMSNALNEWRHVGGPNRMRQ